MIINIIMFHEFHMEIDSRKIDLPKRESELLALLVASGGKKITAKNYWEVIEKPKKYFYNAKFYASASRHLCQALTEYGVEKIVETGLKPVRFCRINIEAIKCDYYEMLDGKTKLMEKEYFLPNYPWGADFYCRSREKFNNLLAENSLFKN